MSTEYADPNDKGGMGETPTEKKPVQGQPDPKSSRASADAEDATADANPAEQEEEATEDKGAVNSPAHEPLNEFETKFSDRLMKHLEQNHPAIKYMCGEYKKYMDTQGAMAAPAATNGYLPEQVNGKKKPGETTNMARSETPTNYALEQANHRIAALELESATLYATQAVDQLIAMGKVIKDKPKEIKRLVALPTLEARRERIEDIRINYADAERSPASYPGWINTGDIRAHVEGATTPEETRIPSPSELVRYGEENKVDITTDAGLSKAMKALAAKEAA